MKQQNHAPLALLRDYLFLMMRPELIRAHYEAQTPLFAGERVWNENLLKPEYLSEFLKLRVGELEIEKMNIAKAA